MYNSCRDALYGTTTVILIKPRSSFFHRERVVAAVVALPAAARLAVLRLAAL